MDDYRRRAEGLGIPPELIATEKIFAFQKNMMEFCRAWQDDRPVIWSSVYGTIDMLRLNVAVLDMLVEERERG